MLTVFLVTLAIYLMWMDVAFYLEIQNLQPRSATNPTTEYTFSVFQPITVKLMMLTPTIQFIDEPLSYTIIRNTNVAQVISPNVASLLGVLVAAISARFLVSDNLKFRQLGVLLFKVRDLIDGLDGNIARERSQSHSTGLVANTNSWGWYVDGYCDAAGDILRFIALVFYLHKVWWPSTGKSGYSLLDSKLSLDSVGVNGQWNLRLKSWWHSYQRPLTVMVAVGLQSLFSSVLWNYFMVHYHNILETDSLVSEDGHNKVGVAIAQNMVLKSSAMWMVCYFWRLVSPVAMTQLQLVAILYNREVDLLPAIYLLGYLPPAILGLCTALHMEYATSVVSVAAAAAAASA